MADATFGRKVSRRFTCTTINKSTMKEARTIGSIVNWDQGLFLKQESNRFYWNILSCDSPGVEDWEEIPGYLFLALNRFEDERQQAAKEQAVS